MNYFKKILYCGQYTDISCDGNCKMAQHIGWRSGFKRDENFEGDDGWSLTNYKTFPNRWCARACDRCKILELEDAKKKYGHTRLLRQPK